jgi:hypothetical protein
MTIWNQQSIKEISIDRLSEPVYYADLFGHNVYRSLTLGRIVEARRLDGHEDRYEVIVGVDLLRSAVEQGIQTLHVIILEMNHDEARRYATDRVLRLVAQAAKRNEVQLIVAARDNEEHGGDWSVDRVTKQIGIKRSTYTHAWSSINYVCTELKKKFPAETRGLGTTELVAMAVRTDFMPSFTSLYQGRMSINKFYREHYMISDLARERSRQQQEAKAINAAARHDTVRNQNTVQLEVMPLVAQGLRRSAGASSNVIPLHSAIPGPLSRSQLIAEGLARFSQALMIPKNDAVGGKDEISKELAPLLDRCQELRDELRQICMIVLSHLSRGADSVPGTNSVPFLPLFDSVLQYTESGAA